MTYLPTDVEIHTCKMTGDRIFTCGHHTMGTDRANIESAQGPLDLVIYGDTPFGKVYVEPVFFNEAYVPTFGDEADGWRFSNPISCVDQPKIWSPLCQTLPACIAAACNHFDAQFKPNPVQRDPGDESDHEETKMEETKGGFAEIFDAIFGDFFAGDVIHVELEEVSPLRSFLDAVGTPQFVSIDRVFPPQASYMWGEEAAEAMNPPLNCFVSRRVEEEKHPDVEVVDRFAAAADFLQKARGYYGSLAYGRHRDAIEGLVADCHEAAMDAGWWDKERPVPEMIALMHSELSEMMESDRKDTFDDHLPHRSGVEVEAADLLIRLMDFAGGLDLDIAGAYLEKRAYNATRADHKRENRAQAGGKKY